MKKNILYLFIFLCSVPLFAQSPTVKFYLNDASFKSYNIGDIDNIGIIKSQNTFNMKIFYQDTLTATSQTAIIDSIKFESVNNIISNLVIYLAGVTPLKFALVQIDSIVFSPYIPSPKISSINPTSAQIGDEITITGSGFGATQGTSIVSFGAITATNYTSWSATEIKVKVPVGASSGKLSVTANSQKSNEVDFTLIIGPTITGINPATLVIGDTVTITGTGFGASKGTSKVSFGLNNATEIVSWSDTQIQSKVPAGTVSGKLSVTVNGVKSNEVDYSITGSAGLVITSIQPTAVSIGDIVTLTGKGFGASRTTSFVSFNSLSATDYTNWSASEIKVKVPIGTKTGKVSVTVGGNQSNEVDFGILPKITKVTPDTVGKTEFISIKGSSFGDTPDTNGVYFNSIKATEYQSWSDTLIVVKVANNAASGKILVKVNGYKSNEANFTIKQFITGITPNPAKIGEEVTITGFDFGSTQGTNYVSFNSSKVVSYPIWSDTLIKVIVPDSANSGKVSVTIGTMKSNDVNITILPKITSITPAAAKLGDFIKIAGFNLGDGRGSSYVSFNGTNSTEFQNWSNNEIELKVPTVARNGKVSVTANNLKSNEMDFEIAPTITNINPGSGIRGDQVTITGISFWSSQGTSVVSFAGSNASSYQSWSDTEIRVTVPQSANSGKVKVTVGSFISNEVDFTMKPNITNVSPNSSTHSVIITITGTDFGATRGYSIVTFNTTVATDYPSWSNTSIEVKLPRTATTGKVFVTVNGVASNEVDFTVIPPEFESVIIGNQEWMLYNLNVSTYRNGDAIPQVTDQTEWANLTTGAWCYYNNSSDNGTTYGKLYNWYAINDARGLAPNGWHVPTDAEFNTLTDYLGGLAVAGGKLKETGTAHWITPNTGASNESGFTALPGGYRIGTGFGRIGENCLFWVSTEENSTNAWSRYLYNTNGTVARYGNNKGTGFSVRCLKN
ncbi:MAG: hypothetical protein HW421_358 [Ignavibacteria bacterium]|nr:hypothetical protein [Ignavibacteria bacterium]